MMKLEWHPCRQQDISTLERFATVIPLGPDCKEKLWIAKGGAGHNNIMLFKLVGDRMWFEAQY
jgi:hypothetical protein